MSGLSVTNDLHRAVGQCLIYRTVLSQVEPGVPLYLAVSAKTFDATFKDELGELILNQLIRQVMVFDADARRVLQWIG